MFGLLGAINGITVLQLGKSLILDELLDSGANLIK
jgi:hypothetical protein